MLQVHIATRQVKRLEAENQRLRDELDSAATKHNVDRDALRDAQRKNESLATEVN